MLLRYGAKLYIINWRGMTALHEAVLWRRTDMVNFLLGMTGPALINRDAIQCCREFQDRDVCSL